MKLSFMSFTTPEASLEEMIKLAQKYNYEGIEPRAEAGHKHGVEIETSSSQRKQIAKMFEDSGVECACIATSIKYVFREKSERESNIQRTRKFIELAAKVDCSRLRVFGGMPPEGMKMEEAIALVGDSLAALKDFAEEHKVYVCLETHDGFMRADDCAAAVKRAGGNCIRVNWDIMHPFTKGMSIEEAFAEVKALVQHCHIHDGIYTQKGASPELALMGEGDISYPKAVKLLQEINYEGFLSGEWINAWPADEVLPHDGKVLREYMKGS